MFLSGLSSCHVPTLSTQGTHPITGKDDFLLLVDRQQAGITLESRVKQSLTG